jgi:hypothetical protein
MNSLYQIYYKPEHLDQLYSFAKPVENKGLTIFFENEVISRVVSDSKDEKLAICSWKLARKLYRSWPITHETIDRDYEVLSFTKNGRDHRMIAMATHWHPDFLPAITKLWAKLGLKMPGEAKNPIYQNHYAARIDIYRKYVTEFLKPAMELIENDEELNGMMVKPSNYGKMSRDADLKSVNAKLGMTDYPMCPFVLERCPALWYQINNVRITYL